jgi:hypothetical protein
VFRFGDVFTFGEPGGGTWNAQPRASIIPRRES